MSVSWAAHIPRVRDVGAVGAHAGAHHVASRIALSALIPSVLLVAIGRTSWLPFVLLLIPTAVYGRRAPCRRRLAMQVEVGFLLLILVLVGTAASMAAVAPAGMVLLTGAVAAVGALAADVRRWTPPGALFFVFAFAVCGSRPAQATDCAAALAVGGGTLAFTIAVTATLSSYDPLARRGGSATASTPLSIAVPHASVCLVACVAAESVALIAGFTHPYWAAVSAVVPVVGLTTRSQLVRAAQRLAGTVLGVGLAAALFHWQLSGLAMVVMFAMAMGLTELFAARNYAISLVFMTPLTIGLALPHGNGSLSAILAARLAETMLGVAVAAVCIVATHHSRHPRNLS